ncbi:MAG: LCP family protein [Clostridia bacterium]|nr:LCP family protein [Clostridia bacterium]
MSEKYKKYLLIAAALTFAVILATVVATLIFGNREGERQQSDSATEHFKGADKPYCILVTGEDKVSGLCDVIMLVSVDTRNERICVMQIPRDTYAEYTDKSYKKLNGAANALGGVEGLRAFLSQSLGVTIDGYLALDLASFRRIIDTVGGVEIELDRAIRYTDAEQGLFIDLPSGRQVLDGKKAEMLVRYRKGYADGDIGRLGAQKKFLASLFASMQQKVNSDNAYPLAEALMDGLDTDIGIATAVALGLEALTTESERLIFVTAPGEQTVAEKSGASYYVLSAASTDSLLCEYFGKSEGQSFDESLAFRHPSYEGFISIYESAREPLIVSAKELQ